MLKYEKAVNSLDCFESLCGTIIQYTEEADSYYEKQDVSYYETAGELLDEAQEKLNIITGKLHWKVRHLRLRSVRFI